MSLVHIDTASSNREHGQHELSITGLREPLAFKKLVWAMKRAHVPAQVSMDRATDDQEAVGGLLREIRDELRRNNELMQGRAAPTAEVL